MPRDTETLATLDDGDALHLILSCSIFACGSALLQRSNAPNSPLSSPPIPWPRFDSKQPGSSPPCSWGTPKPSRSEEHTSELQSLMRISYAVFCLKKKTNTHINNMKLY